MKYTVFLLVFFSLGIEFSPVRADISPANQNEAAQAFQALDTLERRVDFVNLTIPSASDL